MCIRDRFRKRELDFWLTFALLMLVAVATFFPINPGTKFNQHLSLILGEAWIIVLLGDAFLIAHEVDGFSARVGKNSVGLGPVSYTHLDVYKRQVEEASCMTCHAVTDSYSGDQYNGFEPVAGGLHLWDCLLYTSTKTGNASSSPAAACW